MANEPGAAVLTIFEQLISRIKSSRPIKSDKTPLETGFVYSQLMLGRMIDPRDYGQPWTPAGGSSLQPAQITTGVQGSPIATQPGAGAPAAGAEPAVDPRQMKAKQAAFNVGQLVDELIMVTDNDRYLSYPQPRKVSFAYESIINGMQPMPAPPIAPEVQKRIDAARKLLYDLDEDGDPLIKSKIYKRYEKNARAYGEAVAAFAEQAALANKDPAKSEVWPIMARTYQRAVDEAYDTLKAEGAEKVENALGVIESVGLSVQNTMIAKARKAMDVWKINLTAVPDPSAYAMILPTGWCEPDNDSVGWNTLTVDRNAYSSHIGSDSSFFHDYKAHQQSSSTSVSAGGSYFGFGASGSYNKSSASGNAKDTVKADASSFFSNDAKNLKISLQYGLVDVVRPWLLGDLFYMKNWYLVNNRKNSISDGKIKSQVEDANPLLPMIPMQALVVRNVKISTKEWGSDGKKLQQLFGDNGSAWDSSSSGFSASASFGFGPFSAKASVSHQEAAANQSNQQNKKTRGRQDFEAHFNGETFEIKGTQIVAWLSTVTPANPPLDDPGLAKEEPAKAKAAAGTTTPAKSAAGGSQTP